MQRLYLRNFTENQINDCVSAERSTIICPHDQDTHALRRWKQKRKRECSLEIFFLFAPCFILFPFFIFAFGITVKKRSLRIHRSHGNVVIGAQTFSPASLLLWKFAVVFRLISRATRPLTADRFSSAPVWSSSAQIEKTEKSWVARGRICSVRYICVRMSHVRVKMHKLRRTCFCKNVSFLCLRKLNTEHYSRLSLWINRNTG